MMRPSPWRIPCILHSLVEANEYSVHVKIQEKDAEKGTLTDVFTNMPRETDVIQHRVKRLMTHQYNALWERYRMKLRKESNRVCVDFRELNKITEVTHDDD